METIGRGLKVQGLTLRPQQPWAYRHLQQDRPQPQLAASLLADWADHHVLGFRGLGV